jgi:acyl-CoA dehydrogenase
MSTSMASTAGTMNDTEFQAYLARIDAFTDERLIPAERQVEHDDALPDDLVDEMRALGLFGLTVPAAYDGLELTAVQQVRATMAFTRASAAYRSRFSTTLGLGSQVVLLNGTEEQRRRYLPRFARGEWTAAFALTEPEVGSDAAAVQCRATRDGDEYVIDGTKRYITNAPEADVVVLIARTDHSSPGPGGLSAFVVETAGLAGYRVGHVETKLGQRGSHVGDLHFERCRIPPAWLVGGTEGTGFKCAMDGVTTARLHVAATCVGQARRLIAEALRYASDRHQFGRPILEFQAIEFMLADSETEMLAARALVLDTATRVDAGEKPRRALSAAKYFASEMVCRVADRAVQILGGAGYVDRFPVERLYRDVRLFRIFEGTSQIHQRIIANDMRSGTMSR